jgi:putative addiction module component (TIGR02574 family)
MSSAATDASIHQLRALPLKRRLQIMGALLDSIESEGGAEPGSEEFPDEMDHRDEEDAADPSPTVSWHEVRTEIRTVCTHYHRCP